MAPIDDAAGMILTLAEEIFRLGKKKCRSSDYCIVRANQDRDSLLSYDTYVSEGFTYAIAAYTIDDPPLLREWRKDMRLICLVCVLHVT